MTEEANSNKIEGHHMVMITTMTEEVNSNLLGVLPCGAIVSMTAEVNSKKDLEKLLGFPTMAV